MTDKCIICGKELPEVLMSMNMDFHNECSGNVISTALEVLVWSKDNEQDGI